MHSEETPAKGTWQMPVLWDLANLDTVTMGGQVPNPTEVHCTQPSQSASAYSLSYYPNTSGGVQSIACSA